MKINLFNNNRYYDIQTIKRSATVIWMCVYIKERNIYIYIYVDSKKRLYKFEKRYEENIQRER